MATNVILKNQSIYYSFSSFFFILEKRKQTVSLFFPILLPFSLIRIFRFLHKLLFNLIKMIFNIMISRYTLKRLHQCTESLTHSRIERQLSEQNWHSLWQCRNILIVVDLSWLINKETGSIMHLSFIRPLFSEMAFGQASNEIHLMTTKAQVYRNRKCLSFLYPFSCICILCVFMRENAFQCISMRYYATPPVFVMHVYWCMALHADA